MDKEMKKDLEKSIGRYIADKWHCKRSLVDGACYYSDGSALVRCLHCRHYDGGIQIDKEVFTDLFKKVEHF